MLLASQFSAQGVRIRGRSALHDQPFAIILQQSTCAIVNHAASYKPSDAEGEYYKSARETSATPSFI
jgi:hypothetical protein